jgi:hypothetical protein
MYRRGDVSPARSHYVFQPGEALFNRSLTPANATALRTAMEVGRLSIALPSHAALPWLKAGAAPAGALILRESGQTLIDPQATEVLSDTSELRRQWIQGIYSINTPRSQAAMGWLGGKTVSLAAIEIRLQTPNATVAVQSLDGAAIAQSQNLMITLAARSVPQENNQAPFHTEPITGSLTVRAPAGLKLYRRAPHAGGIEVVLPAPYRDGAYLIELKPDLGTAWLYLKP